LRTELREAWVALQKAETMLVQTGGKLRPPEAPALFEGVELERTLRPLLVRLGCGFDPQHLRAKDYLTRYPFSSLEAIEEDLRRLDCAGMLDGLPDGGFVLTDEGRRTVKNYAIRVGTLIDGLALGPAVEDEQMIRLLDYDRRIVDALRESMGTKPSPIFEHRLRGLYPKYDPPRRWHHWPLVWSMIAAHEDVEEQVRLTRRIDPLAWFARHELWFSTRRPHRARMRTCADLQAVTARYAPLEDPDRACEKAIGWLREQGWIEGSGDACGLSAEGLAQADRDEAEIDGIFLSRWPAFTESEIEEMRGIAETINRRCGELLAGAT